MKNMALTRAEEAVLFVLKEAGRGPTTARVIHARLPKGLVRREKYTEFHTRQVLNRGLRAKGFPICSGSCGFWLTDDPEELRRSAVDWVVGNRIPVILATRDSMFETAEKMERDK